MKIKRLELTGFKSFVDKTLVEFPTGVTGIVGPNGCGKSNIVDAIRWVLGEQSHKNLRGKTMEDVIFNGSEDRVPTGMAEVVLTFDNSEGRLGGAYSAYSEISIGRRLFRSGESEYLINRANSRLRDIQEIFMDTGVGSRAHYSIIEQGKVSLVLSSKPEERRILIEEAAGISKFRIRKEAALRRIESTKQNLLRITDVVSEVKRQLEYMRRQAAKAKRHMEIRGEAQGLQSKLWKIDFREEHQKYQAMHQRATQLEQEEEQQRVAIARTETQIEQKRLENVEFEKEIQGVQEKVYAKQSRIQVLENDQEHYISVLEDLIQRREKTLAELESAKERLAVSRGLSGDARAKLQKADEQEEDSSSQLEKAEGELKAAEKQSFEADREVERIREEINSLITKIANGGTTLDNLDHRRIELSGRLAKSKVEEEEIQKRLSHFREILAKNEQKLQGVQQLQLELKTKTEKGQESLEELTQNRALAESQFNQARERLTTLKSRLHVLEDLQANFEGLAEGARSIMLRDKEKTTEVSPSDTHGVLGLVADLISLPKEYERAAEAALGDRLQYVVVKNQQEGVAAIDYLNAQAAGRSTFIPLHIREFREARSQEPIKGEGVIGPMLSLVDTPAEYLPIVRYLFGNVVVVKSLKNALDIWSRNGNRKTLVTIDGEVLDPYGVVSGGKRKRPLEESAEGKNADESSSLLSRKRVIQDLKSDLQNAEREFQEAQSKVAKLTERQKHSKVAVESLQNDRHQEELRLVKHQKDISQIREECKRCGEVLNRVAQRRKEEEESLREIQGEEEKTSASIRTGKEEKITLTSQMDRIKENHYNLRSQVENLKDNVIQMRVRLAELREQKGNAQREVHRLDQEIQDRENRISILLDEISRGTEEEGRLKEKKDAAESEIRVLLDEMRESEVQLNQKRDAFQEKDSSLKEMESQIRKNRQIQDQASHELSDLKIKVAQANMLLENMKNEAQHWSDLSLDLLVQEALHESSNEEGPSEFEGIEKARSRLAELKEQLSNLGEVNLSSITELEELSQRHIFLNRQREDLERSIESLQKTIHRVDRTSRERFREAFDAVNAKFKEVFPRLFGGGKASLILTDENDLLTTGVDLLCQPPGKKIQNVQLLSGGEIALASICLILAIFLIKPSPFCLLDEVDAPLDDANISRFNDLLHELARESQLILITHNRHTMEIAEHLYGVTMEEPGVSRLVSVQMN